ncbi:MAG: DNA-formamidopyrimidine glycosylase family protein [Gaiellaceae bacterium]
MPEGDSLRAIAASMQPLVGEVVSVEAVHPRARLLRVAERLDGHELVSVDAYGKNLILRFKPDLVLVSHLMMRGRWSVRPLSDDSPGRGKPWLRITSSTHEATQWNGPVLELGDRRVRRAGPDIMERPARIEAVLTSLRAARQDRAIGDVLLDQHVVAGIGNLWRSEILFLAKLPPQQLLGEISDPHLRAVIELASDSMSEGRNTPSVYRRARRPCRVCGSLIASRRLGDHGRNVYWCPSCQAGNARPST